MKSRSSRRSPIGTSSRGILYTRITVLFYFAEALLRYKARALDTLVTASNDTGVVPRRPCSSRRRGSTVRHRASYACAKICFQWGPSPAGLKPLKLAVSPYAWHMNWLEPKQRSWSEPLKLRSVPLVSYSLSVRFDLWGADKLPGRHRTPG